MLKILEDSNFGGKERRFNNFTREQLDEATKNAKFVEKVGKNKFIFKEEASLMPGKWNLFFLEEDGSVIWTQVDNPYT